MNQYRYKDPDYHKRYRQRNRAVLEKRAVDWRKANPERALLIALKQRAKNIGVPFNLTIEDVTPPKFCPVLGIRLVRDARPYPKWPLDNSPSVDRIIPKLGYTKGNVVVVSMRANRIKTNATVNELRKVADFYSSYKHRIIIEGEENDLSRRR